MIKASVYLTRRPDLTSEEFAAHWRDEHAPLLMSLPDFTSRVRRYTQQHRLQGIAVESLPYDGVAEMWLDGPEDVAELFQSSAYQETVVPDEEKFLDRSKTTVLITTEQVIIG